MARGGGKERSVGRLWIEGAANAEGYLAHAGGGKGTRQAVLQLGFGQSRDEVSAKAGGAGESGLAGRK